jgi:hypothetical protein
MKIASLVATAALLAGCSAAPSDWPAETLPVLLVRTELAERPNAERCRPLDITIVAEAKDVTPIAERRGDVDALAAALMVSETRKNARLRDALHAYERCRQAYKR